MTAPEHRAGSEFRIAGRVLTGTVLRYGDTATVTLRDGRVVRERFNPGAFAPIPDVPLVMQHDDALVIARGGDYILSDGPRELAIRAELRADSAALDLVRAGALRGYSFRFWPKVEAFERGERVISKARIGHVGLVTAGAYPQSTAELRARSGRTLRSRIPTNTDLVCECIAREGAGSGGACVPMVRFQTEAARLMAETIDEAFEAATAEIAARDVLAVHGNYRRPIASASRGTLRARAGDDGVTVEIDIPRGVAGDALVDAHESTGVVVRPLVDEARSDFQDTDTGREYRRPHLRALLIGSTDNAGGWPRPALTYDGADDGDRAAPAPAPRRRRAWL